MKKIIILSILLLLYTSSLFLWWDLTTSSIKTWIALFTWEILAQIIIESYFKLNKDAHTS